MFFYFLIGCVVASFTQCLAYRYQRHATFPTYSICPHCQHRLSICQLIPILSYLKQNGRCSHCTHAIPFLYPLFECCGGVLACFIALFYTNTTLFSWLIIGCHLFVMAQFDYEHQLIPNRLQLSFLFCGLFIYLPSPLEWCLILGFWFLYCYLDTLFPQCLGAADMKILLILFIALGLYATLQLLLISCSTALIYVLLFKKRKIPFVPFLFIGWLLLFSIQIIHHYSKVIH